MIPYYDAVVLADSPVGYWELNEVNGSSTVADSSGGGFTGTAVGSPSLGDVSFPKNIGGTTLALAGDPPPGSRFTIAPSGALLAALQAHDFSVEIWMFVGTSLPTSMTAFSAGGGVAADTALQFMLQTGSLLIWFTGGDGWSAVTPSAGVWHHVVFTFTNSTRVGHCYVDGVDVGSTNTFTGSLNVANSNWAIGGAQATYNSWKGKLSRLAVYNTVLSSTQVARHFAAGTSVPLAEGAAAADVLSRGAVRSRILADNATVGDVLTPHTQIATLADGAAADSEVLTRAFSPPRFLFDIAAAVDTFNRPTRSMADNARASDVLLPAYRSASASDSAAAVDVLSRASARTRSLFDIAAAVDTFNRPTRSSADNARASDVLVLAYRSANSSDGAAAGDALSRKLGRSRVLADNAAASDVLSHNRSRLLADNAAASDALVPIYRTAAASDAAAAVDTFGRSAVRSRSLADFAAAPDVLFHNRSRVLADNALASDALVRIYRTAAASDAAAAADGLSRTSAVSQSLADNAASLDTQVANPGHTVPLADGAAASDSISGVQRLLVGAIVDTDVVHGPNFGMFLYVGATDPEVVYGPGIWNSVPVIAAPGRWTFYDPATAELGTFVLNPEIGDDVDLSKKEQSAQITDAGPFLSYAQDNIARGNFTGKLLTKADVTFFDHWFTNRSPVTLTDDLGRVTTILFESYEPARVRRADLPWFHTFKLSYVVVGVTADI